MNRSLNRLLNGSPHRPLPPATLLLLALPLLLLAGPATARVSDGEAKPATRVVNAAGEPVAGAAVEVLQRPRADSPFAALTHRVVSGETGDEGHLSRALPALDDMLVVVDHSGHGPYVETLSALPRRVVLLQGRMVSGRAVAEGSTAPDEGRACATWTTRHPEWHWQREWRRCADLDEDGRFEIAGLPTAPARLEIQAAGFLPATRPLDAPTAKAAAEDGGPGDTTLIVPLRRGTLISGRVTSTDGQPVADAAVTAGDTEVRAGGDGEFALPVASFPVQIQAKAAGFRDRTLDLAKPPEAGPLRVSLQPGQQLRGFLLSAEGLPLEEAELWGERFMPPGRWSGEAQEISLGEGGEFKVDLPHPGRYRLALAARGHRPARLPETVLDPGQAVDLGAVVLDRGGTLEGWLADADTGLPLEGASVKLFPVGAAFVDALRRGALARTTSAADGSFDLGGLEAGEYELRVEHRDYATLLREIRVERDEAVSLGELTLGPGVRLFGTVVDRRGGERGGVTVEISAASGQAAEPLAVVNTDRRGRFTGLTVQPGEYRLRLLAERPLLSQTLAVPEGIEEKELKLVASSVRLKGQVLSGGEPVAGGLITLSSDLDPGFRRGAVIVRTAGELSPGRSATGLPSTLMDAAVGTAGEFEFRDAPAGPVTVTYYGADGNGKSQRLRVPDQAEVTVAVELEGEMLAGTVSNSETGNAIAAQVRAFDLTGRPAGTATAGEDGYFAFDGLPPGTYRLEATADGHRTGVLDAAEPGGEPVRLALEPADRSGLTVRLTRADGSPAASIQVSVLSAGGHMLRSLLTDPYGIREFPGLPAGSYTVVWTDPVTGTGAVGPVEIEDGVPQRVERVLPAGSAITLTCGEADCAGRAVGGMALFTQHGLEIGAYLPLINPALRFSADGSLPLGRLAPGRYLLRTWTSGSHQDHVLEVPRDGSLRIPL